MTLPPMYPGGNDLLSGAWTLTQLQSTSRYSMSMAVLPRGFADPLRPLAARARPAYALSPSPPLFRSPDSNTSRQLPPVKNSLSSPMSPERTAETHHRALINQCKLIFNRRDPENDDSSAGEDDPQSASSEESEGLDKGQKRGKEAYPYSKRVANLVIAREVRAINRKAAAHKPSQRTRLRGTKRPRECSEPHESHRRVRQRPVSPQQDVVMGSEIIPTTQENPKNPWRPWEFLQNNEEDNHERRRRAKGKWKAENTPEKMPMGQRLPQAEPTRRDTTTLPAPIMHQEQDVGGTRIVLRNPPRWISNTPNTFVFESLPLRPDTQPIPSLYFTDPLTDEATHAPPQANERFDGSRRDNGPLVFKNHQGPPAPKKPKGMANTPNVFVFDSRPPRPSPQMVHNLHLANFLPDPSSHVPIQIEEQFDGSRHNGPLIFKPHQVPLAQKKPYNRGQNLAVQAARIQADKEKQRQKYETIASPRSHYHEESESSMKSGQRVWCDDNHNLGGELQYPPSTEYEVDKSTSVSSPPAIVGPALPSYSSLSPLLLPLKFIY